MTTGTTLEATPNALVDDEEAEVLREFSEILERHRTRGPRDLARLAREAFSTSLGTRASRQEKLALAIARGMESRQRLKEAEGGSLSSDEAARLLGISKTAVLKRLEAGKLLAWREERLKAARFPSWQFNESGELLAGLVSTLACLNENRTLDAWARILFFLQNRADLDGRRPLDQLRRGEVEVVLLAAQAYAE